MYAEELAGTAGTRRTANEASRPAAMMPAAWLDRAAARHRAGRVERVQNEYEDETVENVVGAKDGDAGMCLSMWQPWGSLLVAGIKVAEGRSWPTSHRGRLWIASTAARTDPEVMKRVIEETVASAPDPELARKNLPREYPASSLIGYLDVVDCVTQEQYQSTTPPEKRQSESPYVFIVANARMLPAPLKVSGDHKICTRRTCKNDFY